MQQVNSSKSSSVPERLTQPSSEGENQQVINLISTAKPRGKGEKIHQAEKPRNEFFTRHTLSSPLQAKPVVAFSLLWEALFIWTLSRHVAWAIDPVTTVLSRCMQRGRWEVATTGQCLPLICAAVAYHITRQKRSVTPSILSINNIMLSKNDSVGQLVAYLLSSSVAEVEGDQVNIVNDLDNTTVACAISAIYTTYQIFFVI